jgi:hypothetical protein
LKAAVKIINMDDTNTKLHIMRIGDRIPNADQSEIFKPINDITEQKLAI